MVRNKLLLTAAVLAAGAAVMGGRALWRAGASLGDARARVQAEGHLRFTSRPLTAVLPAGLESMGAPAVFSDAQIYQGHLFIAGPAGLAEYDTNGAVANRYAVGTQLPSAPVTALAVGLAGDSPAPELWIATAGEGLVAYDGRGDLMAKLDTAPQIASSSASTPRCRPASTFPDLGWLVRNL